MIEWFISGGPIMWPILILSVATLAVVMERTFFLVQQQRNKDRRAVHRILELTEHGQLEEASQVGRASSDGIARTLGAGLEHREISYSDAMMEEANRELERYGRGLVILDTAVTLGPLLGLLGTVIGMMTAFGFVGGEGLAGKTEAITGGVAESLITVTFGLAVAIVAILPLNYLNARVEKVRRKLESAMTHMELLLQEQDHKPL